MGSMVVLDEARMLEIEDSSIVSGTVNGFGHLILTTFGGDDIDAGLVLAPNLDDASDTVKGIVRLATDAETVAGTDDATAVTPQDLTAKLVDAKTDVVYQATTSQRGLIEVATRAEALAGTDTARAMTPDDVRYSSVPLTGVIVAGWSGGKPNVVLDAGQTDSGTVSCFLPASDNPEIIAGASVLVTKTQLGQYIITSSYGSRPKFMRQIPCYLEVGSGWWMYSDSMSVDLTHTYGDGPAAFGGAVAALDQARMNPWYLTVTSTGIVQCSGLIARAALPAQWAVIARYPIELAPARNQILSSYGNGAHVQLLVCTDGTIRFISATVSTAYGFIDLDNLRWRTAASVTAGIATFVPLTLNSGWAVSTTAYATSEPGASVTHTPGYTIDADKVAIFEGCVVATVAKAATSDIATLSGLTAAAGIHEMTSMQGGFNYCRIGATGGGVGVGNILNIGIGVPLNGQLSLANMIFLDSTSPTTTRLPNVQGLNGWTQYASWATCTFSKTPDGFVMCHGLWASGTINTHMTYVPNGWLPRFQSLQAIVSVGAIGRVDISKPDNVNRGTQPILATAGTNTWFSLDGLSWAAYR